MIFFLLACHEILNQHQRTVNTEMLNYSNIYFKTEGELQLNIFLGDKLKKCSI